MFKSRVRTGFTLIEVLVVVAIIALLVAILIPSLSAARERAYRTVCAANLHSVGQAMTYYNQDDRHYYMYNGVRNFTTGAWGQDTIGGDSCVALALDMKSIPPTGGAAAIGTPNKKYLRNWDTVVCPATKNKIKKADDLNYNCDSRQNGPADGRFGNSYEWWNGFQRNDFAGPGPISGRAYSNSESDSNGDGFPDCLKRRAIVEKRAAYIIMVLDGDDPKVIGGDDINNWPDNPDDNHGKFGWNVIFGDMHTRFVTREQTYDVLRRSDMSYGHVPEEYRPKGAAPPPPPPPGG